ncbi:MAG: thiol reductant ABC exporter subunit CydC [Acidobacteria bacterium]|nr:thiol reductant ABC exporter subunit CydC [Acidobacteriota bacterium]
MREGPGIVRDALSRERAAVARALGAGVLVTLCTVGLAATSGWLIVRSAQRPGIVPLTVAMGLVQLFALAKATGRYLERTQTHRAALGAMGHVRAAVAREIEPLLPAGLGPHSADVVDTVIGDVERVQDLLTAVAGPLLTSVAAALVSSVVVGVMSARAGGVLLGALVIDAVLVPALAVRFGRESGDALEEVHAEFTGLFDQVAQSGDEFIMGGAQDLLTRRLVLLEQRYDAAQRRRRGVTGVVSALGVLVNGVATIVVVSVSIGDVRHGQLGVALVAVPALMTITALDMVSAVATSAANAARDRGALTRLNALRQRPRPVRDVDSADEGADLAPFVDLLGVVHSYDGHQVLTGVSGRLRPGDVVVLSGPSGNGKTTLARVLAKFLDPTGGRLALGGVEYANLREPTVRGVVGFVDDTPHVFAATLADNLRLARPGASPQELMSACEAAGLGPYLRALPEGLQTRLGGTSAGLSGGEQRRLGVAREVLSGRPIAIFDEPTEGLDDATARALLASLRAHYRQGILVVVSHHDAPRLAGAREWRLDDGVLVELR